ncbi:DNA repair protein RecO [Corynebacterium pseudodiphtheriticum]|uniref:DNA repair protein RecO n=1 Tax=Corynebacterium pseudodiphtheriticum TaxID=37637 RepID=UPI002543220B|nr:DNA repair protein RecO [Corynebacterium pseudodiphtheriticum]MDK4207326.1 DNA repair protein RecO [Corynebacterium pseudodiphtheriticum]MDK4240888.1 DNA repair protein RecO [Corynebacterium pseudodiphtheriticum]MDK4296187.1 DNA repair protein RecO [Corynebacterium pseudodiphtheriticum]
MARSKPYREDAVVVRTYDFGEADRIIVLLTKQHGVVRAVAKGVRRAKSRFGSRLAPFVHLNVQLYPGRSLATITGADTVAFFANGIIDDYERYTSGCAMLEAAERLAQPADTAMFDALLEALGLLADARDPIAVLDSFLLQAMDFAGWAPVLFECAQCGRPGPHHAFHPGVGGACCHECRPSGSADVNEEVLHYMWLLSGRYWEKAAEIAHAHPEYSSTAHRLVRTHLQWHMEQNVKALHIMEQSL